MVEIPKNTYSVSADPEVEKYLKLAADSLKEKGCASFEAKCLNGIGENVAREVAKHLAKAGWFCRLYHGDHVGFRELSVRREPHSSYVPYHLRCEDYP